MSSDKLGFVEKRSVCEEKQFDWKIAIFETNFEDEVCFQSKSPTFSFGKVSWYFELLRIPGIAPMLLYLKTTDILKQAIWYSIGLKRVDQNQDLTITGVLRRNSTCTECYFIEPSEILQRKCELVPSDLLTVTCTLKSGTLVPSKRKAESDSKPKKLISKYEDIFFNSFILFN